MILVEGEKYACIQCIRGHRSSTCQHANRPLVQVRTRGRPSAVNSHRIAVFAEESASREPSRVEKPKKSCKSGCKSGCSCCPTKSLANNGKVIVVRPSKKSLVAVNGGSVEYVGPVEKNKPQLSQYTLNPTFTVQNVTIGADGVVQPKKGDLSCCGSSDFSSNCSVIKFGEGQETKGKKPSCCSSSEVKLEDKQEIQRKQKEIQRKQGKQKEVREEENSQDEKSFNFNVYDPELADMIGHTACYCDDSCTCEQCIIHGNLKIDAFASQLGIYNTNYNFALENDVGYQGSFTDGVGSSIETSTAAASSSSTTPFPASAATTAPIQLPDLPKNPPKTESLDPNLVYDLVFANSCTISGSCACEDDCSCEGCEVHNK